MAAPLSASPSACTATANRGRARPLIIAVLAIAAAGSLHTGALATFQQPQIPATFYGSASIDGKPVPDGTEVRGFIGGTDCTQGGPNYHGTITDAGVAAYVIEVVHDSQVPGCGQRGKRVTFTIGGRPAGQTAAWEPGPHHLDLNAGSGQPEPLPTNTAIPTVSTAQAAATATAAAKFTPRPPGTLPTDAVTLSGTKQPGTAAQSATPGGAASGAGGGAPVVLIILGGVVVLAVLGAVAGLALSRRGSEPPGDPPDVPPAGP